MHGAMSLNEKWVSLLRNIWDVLLFIHPWPCPFLSWSVYNLFSDKSLCSSRTEQVQYKNYKITQMIRWISARTSKLILNKLFKKLQLSFSERVKLWYPVYWCWRVMRKECNIKTWKRSHFVNLLYHCAATYCKIRHCSTNLPENWSMLCVSVCKQHSRGHWYFSTTNLLGEGIR